MAEHETIEPEYRGTVAGQYSAEEHLRAQQEQHSASTGKPLIDPGDVAHPADTGDHDDPTAPAPDGGVTSPSFGDAGRESDQGQGQSAPTPPVGGDADAKPLG